MHDYRDRKASRRYSRSPLRRHSRSRHRKTPSPYCSRSRYQSRHQHRDRESAVRRSRRRSRSTHNVWNRRTPSRHSFRSRARRTPSPHYRGSRDHSRPRHRDRESPIASSCAPSHQVDQASASHTDEQEFPELWGTYLNEEMVAQMESWRKEAEQHFDFALLSSNLSRDNSDKGNRKRAREESEYCPPTKRQRTVPFPSQTIHVNRYHPDFKSLLFKPEITTDMILYCDTFIYCLVAFSMGYFIYDFLDHVMNNKVLSNYEVVLHHIVVIWSFAYDIQYKVNLPYTIIALMTEVNSIFLHARKLMQFDKWPFDHWLYKMVVWLNLITFVRYRLWGILLISWGIYAEWERFTLIYSTFIVVTMIIMYLINPILLWRLLKNDILRHFRSTDVKEKLTMNGNRNKIVNGECHQT